ncbi:MAG: tetratricopeptide repeat protein [Gemmataceae bacterium]|nr:tetratricopeptide repeat protein [Gemmataceae bacterium]
MDCRWTLSLAAALTVFVTGCDLKTFPLWPSSSNSTPKLPPNAPSPDQVSGEINTEWDDKPKELKPQTLVAYARYKEQFAAELAEVDPAQREQQYAIARESYRGALELDPKHVPALMGMAHLYEKLGETDKALDIFQQATRTVPKDKVVWFELGMCQSRRKDWDSAIENLRKAHELDPNDRVCTKTLGMCLARAGRYDESLTILEKVVGKAEAHCTVARMLYQMKQDEAAKQHLQIALQLNPKLRPALELKQDLDSGANAPAAATFVGKDQ